MNNVIEKCTRTSVWGKVSEYKKIKDELFVNWNDLSTCELSKLEKNDCVVWSFAMASGSTYEDAHSFAQKKLNRVFGNGTFMYLYTKNILGDKLNGKEISYLGHSPYKLPVGVDNKKTLQNGKSRFTVKSFMEKYNKGRYVVIVRGHAFAIVDGVMYGNKQEQFNGFRRIVNFVIELK